MVLRDSLVTVGVCVHNGERYLDAALQSALSQSHQRLEILVYDDGSTDGTGDILETFRRENENVVLVRSTHNLGLAYGRQVVTTLAQGDYLIWLDADDLYRPDRVRRLVELAQETGADIIADKYQLIDASNQLLDAFYEIPEYIRSDPHFTRLFERNRMIPHPLLRRTCFRAVHYDLLVHTASDYDFWLKASHAGFRFTAIDEVGLYYRRHSANLSDDHARVKLEVQRIFDQYDLESLRALYVARGYGTSIVDYMSCVQLIFRCRYRDALTYALREWSDEPWAHRDFYVGTILLQLNDLTAASRHLERHLARYPNSPAGLNNFGVCLAMGDRDGTSFFRDAARVLPGYQDATNNLDGKGLHITNTQI